MRLHTQSVCTWLCICTHSYFQDQEDDNNTTEQDTTQLMADYRSAVKQGMQEVSMTESVEEEEEEDDPLDAFMADIEVLYICTVQVYNDTDKCTCICTCISYYILYIDSSTGTPHKSQSLHYFC